MSTNLAYKYDDLVNPEPEIRKLRLAHWQDHLINDYDSDVICVTAGYGTGKTWSGALYTYERVLENFGCDWIWIEPINRLINDVALPTFRAVFDFLGLIEGIHYKVVKASDQRCIKIYQARTRKSSKIILLSGEKPERIVGFNNVAGASIDEAALCSEEVFKNSRSRARSINAKKIQVALFTTPEGLNWVADNFDSTTQEGWRWLNPAKTIAVKVVKSKDPKNPIEIKYKHIRATTYTNAHNLAATYIPNLFENYGHNQNKIDSYVFGYFRPFAEGLAYVNFNAILHQILPRKADVHLPILLTWDFNICPQWVALQKFRDNQARKNNRDVFIALDNANMGGETLEQAVIEFAAKFNPDIYGDTQIRIAGDPTGYAKSHKTPHSDFDTIKKLLNKLGFSKVVIVAIKSAPFERISVEAVNSLFANGQLLICRNCDKVLNSLQRTTWAAGKKEKLHKPQDDTWTHPTDAIKYGVLAETAPKQVFKGARA